MKVLEATTHTARKEHTCDFCGGIIHKGELYYRSTIVDGEIYTCKVHDLCETLAYFLCEYDDEGIEKEYWQDVVSEMYRKEFGDDCDFSQEALRKLLDRLKEQQKSRL